MVKAMTTSQLVSFKILVSYLCDHSLCEWSISTKLLASYSNNRLGLKVLQSCCFCYLFRLRDFTDYVKRNEEFTPIDISTEEKFIKSLNSVSHIFFTSQFLYSGKRPEFKYKMGFCVNPMTILR